MNCQHCGGLMITDTWDTATETCTSCGRSDFKIPGPVQQEVDAKLLSPNRRMGSSLSVTAPSSGRRSRSGRAAYNR